MQLSDAEIRSLVTPTRVHRRVYADSDVFELEMERIFGRAWIFVAHVSQLPQPGDFVASRIGAHPVIVVRHADGAVHVVHNRCPHRGAPVTTVERGSVKFFHCGYHDWTFYTDGVLRSVPLTEGYAGWEERKAAFCLRAVPQVEEYRGFIFAKLSTGGPGLRDFLGPMTTSLDDLVDRAPDGEIEMAGGSFRHVSRGNWKLQVENLNDLMHAGATHRSAVQAADAVTAPVPQPLLGPDRIAALRVNGAPLKQMDTLGVQAFPHGHSFIGGLPRPPRTGPIMEEYRSALAARHGEARTTEILGRDRHINIIYPGLLTQGLFSRIMVITPLSVDRTEMRVYPFRLKGAPPEIFRSSIRSINNSSSPANFVLPDDLSMYRRCQENLTSTEEIWVDFSRGAGQETAGNEGLAARGTHELSMRNAYGAWLDYMTTAA